MNEKSKAEALLATDLHVEATYRLTEALVQSEERMRRRIDLLAEVVFETDLHGVLVFLNNAWFLALGYPTADCLGKSMAGFVLDEDLGLYERILAGQPLMPGDPKRIRLRHADGTLAWMEMSVSRLAAGGVVGALHNVTAGKFAEDELAKLSLVASYTDNMVIIAGRNGLTEWVNPAFVRHTGYALEDIAGCKPGSLLQGPDTDSREVARISQWLKEGRSFASELLNYKRSGEPYWVSMQVTPILGADGNVERFIAIQTDSTMTRKAARELESTMKRAEAANEAKTQFLATMSHEMRTPLNVILGSADLALDTGGAPADLEAHLRRIDANAEILLRFVSDILEVSKIEAGQFDFERVPFKLRECLHGALMPLAAQAREKGLDYKLMMDGSMPDSMLGDPGRLRQIVTNLVENAVKFTDSGSVRVEVSLLTKQAGDGAWLEIRVIDTGSGIEADAQQRIFERFEQADSSSTRRKGGAGLGLNIVKSLVEGLGGQVSVRSSVAAGASFRVILPFEAVPDMEPPAVTEIQRSGGAPEPAVEKNSRVLVADDTDGNYEIVEIFLTRAGYSVSRAVNGRLAVDAALDAEVILMDIEMPEMDGFEATKLIRQAERLEGRKPVPILALTAHAIEGYRERCFAIGFTGFLTKPFRKDTLISAIRTALEEAGKVS